MDNQSFMNKVIYKYLSKLGTKKPRLIEFEDGRPSQIWYRPRPDLPPFIIYTQKGLTPIVDSDFFYRLNSFFKNYFGESKKSLLINSFHDFIRNNGQNYSPEEYDEFFGIHTTNRMNPTHLKDWWSDELFPVK